MSVTSVRFHIFKMFHGMEKQVWFSVLYFHNKQVFQNWASGSNDLHVLYISKSKLKIGYDNKPIKIKK